MWVKKASLASSETSSNKSVWLVDRDAFPGRVCVEVEYLAMPKTTQRDLRVWDRKV